MAAGRMTVGQVQIAAGRGRQPAQVDALDGAALEAAGGDFGPAGQQLVDGGHGDFPVSAIRPGPEVMHQ